MIPALIVLLLGALTQETPRQPSPTPEQQKQMMEKMQPGPQHRELAALAGRWSQEVTYTFGSQPVKGTGTVTNRMVIGERFLVSEGTHSTSGGGMGKMDVESMTIYGFDRRTNEYTILQFDTMGTYWVSAAGAPRPDKTIVMSGETLDDHGGSLEVRKYDMVLRVIDPDTYVTQIVFKFPNRPPLTLVETTHRRIK